VRLLRKTFLTFFLVLCSIALYSKDLVISRNFVLFTSKNLEGYLTPFFTTLSQSLNNALYGTSNLDGKFRVALNIALSSMLIPDDQKWFDAEVPVGFYDSSVSLTAQYRDGSIVNSVVTPNKQPTIYGGSSTPIFAAPQNHFAPDSFNKTIAYPEGLHLDVMVGLPIIQLLLETPFDNEVRFRFFTFPVQGESFVYIGFALNQRMDEYFNLFGFDKRKNLNVHLSYQTMYRGSSFSFTTYSLGVNAVNEFSNKILGYVGIQYENAFGKFRALKDTVGMNEDIVNSPFLELRQAKPIEIALKSFTKFQVRGGFTYTFSFGFLNFDVSFASQPMLSLGLGIFFQKRVVADER